MRVVARGLVGIGPIGIKAEQIDQRGLAGFEIGGAAGDDVLCAAGRPGAFFDIFVACLGHRRGSKRSTGKQQGDSDGTRME